MKSSEKKRTKKDSDYVQEYVNIRDCMKGDTEFKELIDCTKFFRTHIYTVLAPPVA